MVCRTGVSDRAVWHFAATLLCSLPSATQLQCLPACWKGVSSAISENKLLSVGIGYRVLRCNEGWLAAVLGFLLRY